MCKKLELTTTGKDIFEKVDTFFTTEGLAWSSLCGVCSDGALAMLGCRSGFVALVKEGTPAIITTHCFIHRQPLVAKTAPRVS